jgi:hypothetical protein
MLSIGDVFAGIAPYLIEYPTDLRVKLLIKEIAFKKSEAMGVSVEIDDQVFQTIKVHLVALKLVSVDYSSTTKGGMALFWSLTSRGNQKLFEMRAIRSGEQSE